MCFRFSNVTLLLYICYPKKKKNSLSSKNTNVQNIDQTLTWLQIDHPNCVITIFTQKKKKKKIVL